MLISAQAFFYACGMFSGTISGLLGELIENTPGNVDTINPELSLCDFFHERCWWACRLEMGITCTHAFSLFTWAHELTFRQVFILEGLPAIFCGVYTFFFLPDCEFHCQLHNFLILSYGSLEIGPELP